MTKYRARLSASRRAAVLVALVGAAVALAAGVYLLVPPDGAPETPVVRAEQTTDPAEEPATPAAVPKVTYGLPVRLIIPKIGVSAVVEKVGLTSERDMASPSRADTVGWYKFGPRPGNKGSAVIDGHSGYADNREAVFDDLPKLKVGDKLLVKDATGKRLVFVVQRKVLYGRDASAAEVFGTTRKRRLNLITCTGAYDVAAGTHSKRLVVFAELQPQDGR
jgi:LPXTG-site transpeptidase (sortase) family protein